VRLAVLCADARTCAAPDASSRIGDRHGLAQDLLVVVERDEVALFRDALQGHDGLAAHLVTAATPDAGLRVDGQQIRWTPTAAIARE